MLPKFLAFGAMTIASHLCHYIAARMLANEAGFMHAMFAISAAHAVIVVLLTMWIDKRANGTAQWASTERIMLAIHAVCGTTWPLFTGIQATECAFHVMYFCSLVLPLCVIGYMLLSRPSERTSKKDA